MTYTRLPARLPSYAASRHGQTVTCCACSVETAKIAKNTKRCPSCQRAHERQYRRDWRQSK